MKNQFWTTIACVSMSTALFAAKANPPVVKAELTKTETPKQRDERMKWWREARFGMFVHWGLYSGLAGNWDGKMHAKQGNMEWIQQRVGADTHTYASQAIPKFRPSASFATAWAKLAKQAGCQYVVFTTKHHEGFALHDSKIGQFDAGDVVNRDLVKEITDALRAEGLKVGFYHSVIDWHHPQYDFNQAKKLPYPGNGMKLAGSPRNHQRYIEFLHGQVDELMSNYGQVDVLWWDYSSDEFQGDKAWESTKLINMVRKKQPRIIMNNRLFRIPEAGFNGMSTHSVTNKMDTKYGDFVTPEQFIPETGLPGVDWETCMTMNTTWGYNQHDQNWKSSQQIIRNLINAASKGGNYLINIGPTEDGSIPKASIDCMSVVGQWMDVNAESIRGTTGSPIAKPLFDGRITTKGKIHYAHVFSKPADGAIRVPFGVKKATLLAGSVNLEVKQDGDASVITLPAALPDTNATVLRLE
jgi:alpha-L-fucosidase